MHFQHGICSSIVEVLFIHNDANKTFVKNKGNKKFLEGCQKSVTEQSQASLCLKSSTLKNYLILFICDLNSNCLFFQTSLRHKSTPK